MHIAFLSSEAVPFSKTGGLADVAGALPAALAESGHQVSVFTPYYRSAKKVDPKPKKIAEGAVPVGAELVPWTLYQSSFVKDGAVQYLIANEPFFDREGLYGTPTGDYQDSSRRFIFFNRAVLAAVQALQTPVDVYHANDWQTALVPVLLRISFSSHPFHAGAATLFTIHNMSYQGLFWHWDWPLMNLPWKHFHWKEMEFYGKINFLKGALIYSDILNTVSPTYAQEIQSSSLGCGLEGVLKDRAVDLFGVVNGIDMRVWNPANDPALPVAFSAENPAGRAASRKTLLERFNLPTDGEGAVIGIVSRLIEQKGFDLVAQALEDVLKRDVRLVVLGTGEEKFQAPIMRMREVFPDRVGVSLAYDNTLAHLIYAGSDIFLMPSKFEPCGLSQLYSLRYGSVPLVRKTGGLIDTVVDATPEHIEAGSATGFAFEGYEVKDLLAALDRALEVFTSNPDVWRGIQLAGMRQDWSWKRSAKAYLELYEKAREKARARSVPT